MENPARQAEILGVFNNPAHRFAVFKREDNEDIDMVASENLLGDGERPAARLLMSAFTPPTTAFTHLLLGTSGSGKTSALADLARVHFAVQFTCVDSSRPRGRSNEFDPGFEKMFTAWGNGIQGPSRASAESDEAEVRAIMSAKASHVDGLN